MILPTRLLNTGQMTLKCFLAETNAAKVEVANVSVDTTTLVAATYDA